MASRCQELQCPCNRQCLFVAGSKIKAQRDLEASDLESRKTTAFSKFPQAHQTSDLEKLTSSLFSWLIVLYSATKESLSLFISHTSFYSFIHIDQSSSFTRIPMNRYAGPQDLHAKISLTMN